jgi:SAM-dependent methyltransferase
MHPGEKPARRKNPRTRNKRVVSLGRTLRRDPVMLELASIRPGIWLVQSLRDRGPVRTLKVAVNVLADLSFDWKHGTDTMKWVDVDFFETASQNKSRAVRYQATKVRPLAKLLSKLRLPTTGSFLDLGCGKGRVLLIASQLGYRRVVGVEFCSHLCRQARQNVDRFRTQHPDCSPIDVIESDVALYRFAGDESVLFMYNPFDQVVVKQTMDNVRTSVRMMPRDIWLIYNTPLQHETIQQQGDFGRCQRYEIGGTTFHVYSQFNPRSEC